MEFIIVTGLSGAGKTQAIRIIEDLGYFCVDNMPPQLIPKFGEICRQTNGSVSKIAFVIDIRGMKFFDYIDDMFEWFRINSISYKVLFLDCSDSVLIRRFKETRRLHPLSYDGRILNGIFKERKKLEIFRNKVSLVIDTSDLKVCELMGKIEKFMVCDNNLKEKFIIQIISFGYKYGIPLDCDLTFDVRFIKNPFYIDELKKFSGLNLEVKKFVLENKNTIIFLDKIFDIVDFLLPNYIKEGKKQLVIGIGCTGGYHRSVAISEEIYKRFSNYEDYKLVIEHRDLEKNKY